MAKQGLNIGTTSNDNTGDTLRVGGDKINDNFNEIYSALGNGTNLTVSTTNPASGQVLRYNGTNFIPSDYTNLTAALDVNGNSIISASNGNIIIAPNAPNEADSVGVAIPKRIEPKTKIIKITGGNITLKISLKLILSTLDFIIGKLLGLKTEQNIIQIL